MFQSNYTWWVDLFIDAVSYVELNSAIGVYSSSALSKASQNGCVQCLCFISCLWIIFWPIYCMMNKNMDNKIIARYQVAMNMELFQQAILQVVPPLVYRRAHNANIAI